MPVVRTQKPTPTSAPARPTNNKPAAAASTATNKPTAASPTRSARKYIVRSGDTLVKISQSVYGSRTKWREIYQANRAVMKSESDLRAGMELTIP